MLQFWEHTTLERPGPGSDTITQNEVFRASFKSLRLTQSPQCLLEGDLCSFLLFPCLGFLKTEQERQMRWRSVEIAANSGKAWEIR
jgi:hypothetical protein